MASKKSSSQSSDKETQSVHPFIDAKTAMEAYVESKRWMRPYNDPIDEFERLMRGKPSTNIPSGLPKVTDGTIASIIQDDPKRIIQQEPTGLIECKEYEEYAQLADYELTHTLIPRANRSGSELQKDWIMTGKALGWGRATSYTFYTNTNGILHADFVIPYIKDVILEKGKVFAPDCNIRFMRSWYQKRDLQAIINREKWMLANVPGYVSGWDLKKIADFMQGGASAKPADVQTPAEKEKGGDTGGFEVIHAFQVGKKAEFYAFSPQYKDGDTFRTKVNTDPRGLSPFDDLYYEIDLSNPNGRGVAEASGGIQNLIDQQMQMFQFMSTLEMGPPLKAWGNVNRASLKFRPNAIWDMGSNRQANDVEPYQVSNYALQNFPNNYGLLKSQILQRNSSNQGATVSSEAGNPTFSKTQAGVQAQQSQMNINDNYLRKQFEEWKGRQWETAINLQFSEMKGKKQVKLDHDDLKDFMKSPAAKFVKGDVLTIPYGEIENVAFNFTVNPSSSEVKEDADNADKLKEIYALVSQDPDPQIQEKKTKLLKILIDEIGAEGTDDLFPELDEDKVGPDGQPMQGQQPQQQVTPQMVQQMVMETVQQVMQQGDMDAKKQANDLKSREIDLKERQFHADTVLKADKQAHDQELALQGHHNDVEKSALDSLQSLTQPEQAPEGVQKGGVEPTQAEAPLDDGLSPEEEQVVHELTMRGFDENDCEQAIVLLRHGVPVEQVVQALAAKRGAAV